MVCLTRKAMTTALEELGALTGEGLMLLLQDICIQQPSPWGAGCHTKRPQPHSGLGKGKNEYRKEWKVTQPGVCSPSPREIPKQNKQMGPNQTDKLLHSKETKKKTKRQLTE